MTEESVLSHESGTHVSRETFPLPPVSELPAETSAQLEAFAGLLVQWNERINLVSPRDVPNLWHRHIEDSLQLASLITPGATVTDLGSGGGFPGLIIAIACRKDGLRTPVTLVESDQRKCAFLREAARICKADVTVVPERIEQAAGHLAPADYVTARALAPLGTLFGWASPLLKPEGKCLFLKGRKAADELTAARPDWHMSERIFQSRTDPDGTILEISGLKHT
ncbi:16S rRNA (guanine(527)-N(7))-methyltransferase RsmG [Oecophyllibacter saccharovorans]|nr:16S rRNA (guanine(527)-N(7))-methyltransferase RsmG [Oecophyllibacter saccharovorans]